MGPQDGGAVEDISGWREGEVEFMRGVCTIRYEKYTRFQSVVDKPVYRYGCNIQLYVGKSKGIYREEAALDFDFAKVTAPLSLFPRQQGSYCPGLSHDPCNKARDIIGGNRPKWGQVEQHRHQSSPWAAVNLARHSIHFLPRPIAVTTVSI